MIGSVSHPKAVLVDTTLLKDLPDAQLREGLVEIVKVAAILDVEFFSWLERTLDDVLRRKQSAVEECIARAIECKVRIVEDDEHDRTVRLLLNFGHSVGHAVEALSKYKMPHGQAVSIGMAAEMRAARFKDRPRVLLLLKKLRMPTDIPSAMSFKNLWKAMLVDKKTEKGKVRMSVPDRIGRGSVQELTKAQFRKLF